MIKKFLFLAILSTPSLTIAEENITKLGLTSAYQKTMKNSPVIKEAESRLEIAIGKSKQASAWLNPEFEFDIENFSGTGPFKETSIAEYTYTLTQKLEIGGKRSARIDEALKNLKAAQLEYTIAQRNLRKDVAIAYMQAIETEENLKLAEEQAMLAQKVLNTVKNRVQSAREPEIQQRKAEVAYATASLKYKQAVRVNKLTKSKLANLWGDLNLKQNLNTEKFFEIIKPKDYSFYKDQLEESPQLKRYRPLIDAQKSVVNLQKAQNIPDPTFRFGLKKFNENGEQALVAGISFPLPVFNQNGGNIRQALAKVTTIEAQKDQSIILLSQQLNKNWQTWEQSAQEAESLKKSIIPSAVQAFNLARKGYDKGRFPYLEVLDAQRTLFDAHSQYHDALLRMHTSHSEVMALVQNIQTHSTESKE